MTGRAVQPAARRRDARRHCLMGFVFKFLIVPCESRIEWAAQGKRMTRVGRVAGGSPQFERDV